MPQTRPILAAALLSLGIAQAARAADPAPAPAKPAATPAPAAKPSPTAMDLARTLATQETWKRGMDGLTQSVVGQFRGHPGSELSMPKDFQAKARTEIEALLPYEELVNIHARQLSAAYGEAEMKDLLAFYKSPLGQKTLKAMPEVQEKVAVETQQRIEPKLPQVMQKLAKDVKPPAGGAKAPSNPHGAAPAKAAPAKPAQPKK
ncbi:DUF2059 domain-containing protein [Anaeromyxobacter dehalogenans]|uniref:DUF2059 domain-containing protein n=1 Tax=Anaeromyxobacter dehalogenans (strain 2CP-C) TaxID=290397 RepID=Q2IM10_ANADE|nr:DUF2059 domain-containing protein [Anaeromyxobacter dehalogenans]ABC79845.1 hypothetical protein Adeh_0067 [Anaeromyxobacter dehalogenans 2CP-C]